MTSVRGVTASNGACMSLVDKENSQQRTQSHRPSPLVSKNLGATSASSPFSSSTRRRGVLRYGETMESLFGLTVNANAELVTLCRHVTSLDSNTKSHSCDTDRIAPLEQEIQAWRRILQLVTLDTDDLVRLHRRATSRLSTLVSQLDLSVGDSSSTQVPSAHPPNKARASLRWDVLHIWLSYARAQLTAGQSKDAHMTLRHVQHQKLGHEQSAAFYILRTMWMKGEPDRAAHLLREGIEQQAQPIRDLEHALSNVDAQRRPEPQQQSTNTVAVASPIFRNAPSSARDENSFVKTNLSQDSNMSLDDDDDCVLESQGKIVGESMPPVPPKAIDTKESIRFQLAPLRTTQLQLPPLLPSSEKLPKVPLSKHKLQSEQAGGVTRTKIDEENSTSQSSSMHPIEHQQSRQKPFGESIPTTRTSSDAHLLTITSCEKRKRSSLERTPVRSTLLDSKKAPLLLRSGSRKPNVIAQARSHRPPLQLKPLGLLGKAERVDPSQSMLESDDESEELVNMSIAAPSSSKKTPLKFKKHDLEYMFNWDPEKRNAGSTNADGTPATQTNSSIKSSRCKSQQSLKKIEEVESISSGKNANKSEDSRDSHHTEADHKTPSRKIRRQHSLGQTPEATPSNQRSSDKNDRLAKANPDFLPLVCEGNIVRVKNVPYIKLGVIGKGGSCKVYRALSKDCSVLAIKKVKLENLDKKAIDGYSNEIALLKRLRGNPSIIQMYDSEVDLARKAIYLVMEPGEADLNQVLQKQAMEHRLDMNFIRLTWQQMLRAVHSIHEERIIHGDLKPANFLFVRGSLKLIDFGIAKAIQSDDTTNIYRESQIGTLNYMSPEAILDSGTSSTGMRMKCGRPSDIWSLGCILYQMVYGKTPFASFHMIQKLQAIVNPEHVISFPETTDPCALDAMRLCLSRKAEDRPPIVGPQGLLNEHAFLHAPSKADRS